SWAKRQKPIADWLIDELYEKYQVPASLGKRWLKQQQLILLLDGLDEVDISCRNNCVQALNEFIKLFPQIELAVCSRIKDYEALTERLKISSALCLQPFSSSQINQFLNEFEDDLAGLRELISENIELRQFSKTPLILYLMSVAYKGWSAEKLSSHLCSAENQNHHLFNTYVERRLEQTENSDYSRDEILRWLCFLAKQMVQEKQTIFLIERMQPSWFQSKGEAISYRLVNLLMLNIRKPLREISPVEKLRWSWRGIKERFAREALSGLISALTFWLLLGILLGIATEIVDQEIPQGDAFLGAIFIGLMVGIAAAILSGLTLGILSGLGSAAIEQRTDPNQGIRSSWKNCYQVGFVVVVLYGLLGLIVGLFFPAQAWIFAFYFTLASVVTVLLPTMLRYGGTACVNHYILRRILYKKGRIPWDYAKFLDFTAKRQLMKKVGGGYTFFHRMLLEHLAEISP
ncbi:MAG: hypothetical protein WBA01_12295, partial [Phormidesmis sp.]